MALLRGEWTRELCVRVGDAHEIRTRVTFLAASRQIGPANVKTPGLKASTQRQH